MFTRLTKSLIRLQKTKSFINWFAKEDNWHELDAPTANLGYGWIHYSIIRSQRLKNIICIGSRYGFVPAVCAQACKDNGFGQVEFVDAGFDQDSVDDQLVHWGGVGIWGDRQKTKKQFSKFGLEKYIHISVCTSEDFSKQNKNKHWDYVHIDGDHSYEGVKKDYKMFWPKLATHGFMCFHDIYPKQSSQKEMKYGVYRLWRELRKLHKNSFEFKGDYGLGIIQKVK